MDYLLSLIAGFGAACGALTMPGLMNMSVVSKCLDCGPKQSRQFAIGIIGTIMIQASVGIIGSKYLSMNPGIMETLKVWAIPVFVLLACFFVYRGIRRRKRPPKARKKSRQDGNHYLQGMSLAAMNMLAVPYYYLISTWFFTGDRAGVLGMKVIFLLGLAAGAYLLLTTYVRFSKWIDEKANLLTSNLNFIISGMLVLLAITQTFRVVGKG